MEAIHHKCTHAYPILLLASFVILLVAPSTRASPFLVKQEKALLQWRSTLQTPEPLHSWAASNSPCNWTGITCSRPSMAIAGINLHNMSMAGNLDAFDFSAFSSLTVLDLGYNQLNGTIPTTIRFLTKLISLNLCHNRLYGSIPAEVSSLTHLSNLYRDQGDACMERDGCGVWTKGMAMDERDEVTAANLIQFTLAKDGVAGRLSHRCSRRVLWAELRVPKRMPTADGRRLGFYVEKRNRERRRKKSLGFGL